MYYNENFLAHHGILGQKWGVRRFQNKDGTRTPLGKKRERQRPIDHDELIKSTDAKLLYKNRDKLSDRELQDRLNRLRNEDALRQMANTRAKKGKGVAGKVLNKVGEKTAEAIAVAVVGAAVVPLVKKGSDAVKGLGKTAMDMVSGEYLDDLFK